MTKTISCQELLDLLSEYLDGGLPRRTAKAIDAHLAGCDGCTMVLEEFRQTIALTGRLDEEQVTPAQRDLLLQTFRSWTG